MAKEKKKKTVDFIPDSVKEFGKEVSQKVKKVLPKDGIFGHSKFDKFKGVK